jgi:hypothetical protein
MRLIAARCAACLDHPQHDPGKFDRSIRDARRLKNLSARL